MCGVSTLAMQEESSTEPSFESLLEEIRVQLLLAQTHFDIWEALFFRTEEETAVLDRYKGFFAPTIDAHIDRFFIRASNVVGNNPQAPSFYRLFRLIDKEDSLAPGIRLRAQRSRLTQLMRSILDRIKTFRDQRVAHWDTIANPEPVLAEEARSVLSELQDIFNDIHFAHTGRKWSFEQWDRSHTNNVIQDLQKLLGNL